MIWFILLILAVVVLLVAAALPPKTNRPKRASEAPRPRRNPNPMTASEARDILGVKPEASPEAIAEAYRRLMQKNHPDQGGSAYLAQHINEARRILLGK